MSVGLIGRRPDLAAVCRVALAELPVSEWTLVERAPGEEVPEASLIVWDLPAGSSMSDLDGMPAHCHSAFVVHESCLESLCRHLPIAAAVNILVEPASPDETRDFLAHVFQRHLDAVRGPDLRRPERDELLQALLLAGLKLHEFRGERSHFFRRALRDLSGPLTAVGGYCGLLLDQQLGPLSETQLDVLRQMQNSVDRLSSLLSSMLHLSHGGLDPSELELQPGDVTALLYAAIAKALPAAEAREIEIRVDADQPEQALEFDPTLMQQVLSCLLTNACRFTSSRGTVAVRGYPFLTDREDRDEQEEAGPGKVFSRGRDSCAGYRIDIRDFGTPIPSDSLSSVFDSTTVSSGSFDRSEGGLELAMCRMIMQAHKGELCVESGESGTVFSVILPCPKRLLV